ncbi:helicase-associated domain-containing protein [Actinotalea subterranea]|uniref:helicase-associated domain-containing protein n=1 Tax=Actinotalea subterranea TaxID=2607497 RepID=UPI0011EBC76C|nr:helicase-associated domain-containing protein [Actinotalea subterranea]
MATFTQHLRARGEDGLAALLAARPDLASPPPASVRSLAARVANRGSVERALATVDAGVLTVLEAVLALDGVAGAPDPSGVPLPRLAHATGGDLDTTARAVDQALGLALLWTEPDAPRTGGRSATPSSTLVHPAPGLEDALGPYPAGLGPRLVATLARRAPQALEGLTADVGAPEPDAAVTTVEALAAHLADPETAQRLLADAPPGARAVLDALAWGPPVGRSPAAGNDQGPGRAAVEWLLRHGLLAVGDPQHVVLPREVALALRAGRTHREPPLAPSPHGRSTPLATVDAESARAAEDAVRLVAATVAAWGAEPPPVLRAGGLGSRELRRLAARLDVTDAVAALVVEVAGSAGLVAEDGEDPPSFAPTTSADDWLRLELPERWEALVEAWLASERAPWLVGTRDERGGLRAALDPETRRPWAPRLRRTVLEVLAAAGTESLPAGLAAEEVHDVLRWRSPRSAPPLHAVEAVLTEAGLLGILGAGATSTAARALVVGHADGGTGHPGGGDGHAVAGAHPGGGDGGPGADPGPARTPAAALAGQLPPPVDEVLLQGDLTGIVPGRPSPALADVLERMAHVESRGAGLTVRFTEASIRSALDLGRTAEDLLAELSRHARTGVPQPLEYLVLDVARRHGRVRIGVASSYLRAEDPALLAGLVEDRSLRALGLVRLAPTVIAAQAPPVALLAALRERGLAPVTEDATGTVVVAAPDVHRVRAPRGQRRAQPGTAARQAPSAEEARDRRLRRVAKDLLRADQAENAVIARGGTQGPDGTGDGDGPDGGTGSGTPDPVLALALLREAAAEGREVWLEIVGPAGTTTRRRVRPLRVDEGRVRAVDAEREAELTVAVHRIAGVAPA